MAENDGIPYGKRLERLVAKRRFTKKEADMIKREWNVQHIAISIPVQTVIKVGDVIPMQIEDEKGDVGLLKVIAINPDGSITAELIRTDHDG